MELLGIGSRVIHPEFGKGVITCISGDSYEVTYIEDGIRRAKLDSDFEVIERVEPDEDRISLYEVEKSLKNILQNWLDASEIVPLGDRWMGGTMTLEPGNPDLASKSIPIETFFHKIVMMRDRLRVLEQKVNASDLTPEAKIDIQQYISRCYGSMTTFNILFKNKEQQFKS